MGTGMGITCVRCGRGLDYEDFGGYDVERKLCGHCLNEIKAKKWDEENKDIINDLS